MPRHSSLLSGPLPHPHRSLFPRASQFSFLLTRSDFANSNGKLSALLRPRAIHRRDGCEFLQGTSTAVIVLPSCSVQDKVSTWDLGSSETVLACSTKQRPCSLCSVLRRCSVLGPGTVGKFSGRLSCSKERLFCNSQQPTTVKESLKAAADPKRCWSRQSHHQRRYVIFLPPFHP